MTDMVEFYNGVPVIDYRKDGRPIFAIAGAQDDPADPPADPGNGPGNDPDPGTDKEPDWKTEAEKWKNLSRKHEGQAKSNAEAAKKLKELEDADKTEADKAKDAAAVAERRATEAEQRALRLEVAAAKGLTPAQAKRLVGTTQEELEADADELLTSFKPTDKEGASDKGGTGKPKERLRPGAAPDTEPEDNDPRKLAEAVPRDRF